MYLFLEDWSWEFVILLLFDFFDLLGVGFIVLCLVDCIFLVENVVFGVIVSFVEVFGEGSYVWKDFVVEVLCVFVIWVVFGEIDDMEFDEMWKEFGDLINCMLYGDYVGFVIWVVLFVMFWGDE